MSRLRVSVIVWFSIVTKLYICLVLVVDVAGITLIYTVGVFPLSIVLSVGVVCINVVLVSRYWY